MGDLNERNPGWQAGASGAIAGSGLPKNDTEVARALQRKSAAYSLIWDAVLPDLPFLEECVDRIAVHHEPLTGQERTRLHCLVLKLFLLREALNV